MFVIAMVTPGLGDRVTRVQVVRRTMALVAPHIMVLEGQNTMALVDQFTRVPVVRLIVVLEVPVTPVQGGPAIPALVGMVIVAQQYANSSFLGTRKTQALP
jgi:hypothetical protein